MKVKRVFSVSFLPLLLLFLFFFGAVETLAATSGSSYQIGVYYFPGWKDDQIGAVYAKPWKQIQAFPEREPLLGWYRGGEVPVVEQQLRWMHDYGIDYVVYDWYWDGKRTFLEHALRAYQQSENKSQVKYSLLWANHDGHPKSQADFSAMVVYWIEHYFQQDQYLRIDGKPVVFVFSAEALDKDAKQFGMTGATLLQTANRLAAEHGMAGIYFVGGAWADAAVVGQHAAQSGYSALSAYNYHAGKSPNTGLAMPLSHNYAELDLGYQAQWAAILQNSSLPYILPMTSGWDKRPWGGSATDQLHDHSLGRPESFEQHLRAAKAIMDQYPEKTMKTGVICCWNEFGEGSFIEPTKKDGFGFIEKVKKVFSEKQAE